MEMKQIIEKYLAGLQAGNYEEIIKLFSAEAQVHSPLYGKVKAGKFYTDLFNDTSKSTITLRNILLNQDNPSVGAGHFRYDWIMKDGTPTSFECVDIFNIDQSGKIEKLTIIYDTASTTRQAFANLK
ncbi:MAG: nuclear transport factor 2 family protein [Peptococcaceae bacterium]